jgi:xanthine dehydrogenase accessory factor
VLETLERWTGEGKRVATATVIRTEKSAPRDAGAVLAVSEAGEVAGSVTGGCVEPSVYEEAQQVLAGGPPRLLTYGIADDEAFDVGLPCGGTVHIFVDLLRPDDVGAIAGAVREEQPIALAVPITGPRIGEEELVAPGRGEGAVADAARRLLARGETGVVELEGDELFVSSFDERTAVCVLTHDTKFDVPILKVALRTEAGYVGAMGSRRTTEARNERLRAEGLTDEEIARVHAPIGLKIGARTPEEVGVAIAAQIVEVFRAGSPRVTHTKEAVA